MELVCHPDIKASPAEIRNEWTWEDIVDAQIYITAREKERERRKG
jgi:hypothetical protein